jgi:Uma2 family endonuclease
MTTPELLTVEEFVERREELPDGGRWSELRAGKLIALAPPTIEHGTAVLNLTKALSEFSHHESRREQCGYACFELGLIVARSPDTLLFPAISYFAEGDRFAEADKAVTGTRPAVVVEVASTNDRRRGLDQRVAGWLEWGAKLVWVVDPQAKQVHAVETGHAGQRFGESQTLPGSGPLAGFELSVGELFKEPRWAR